MLIILPSTKPASFSPRRKAGIATSAKKPGKPKPDRTPITRRCSCARAASGHVAAAPRNAMNSRRFISRPSGRARHATTFVIRNAALCITAQLTADGRDGSSTSFQAEAAHFRFSPIPDLSLRPTTWRLIGSPATRLGASPPTSPSCRNLLCRPPASIDPLPLFPQLRTFRCTALADVMGQSATSASFNSITSSATRSPHRRGRGAKEGSSGRASSPP